MAKDLTPLELKVANAIIIHENGAPVIHASTREDHMPLGYRGMYLTLCNPNLIYSVKMADNSDIDRWVREK